MSALLKPSPSPYAFGLDVPRGPGARAAHVARIRELADAHGLWELVQQAAFYSGEPEELDDMAVWRLRDRLEIAADCLDDRRSIEWLSRPVF